jgi:hypothetical protein
MHVPYGCTVLFADQGWNGIERKPDEAASLQSAAPSHCRSNAEILNIFPCHESDFTEIGG